MIAVATDGATPAGAPGPVTDIEGEYVGIDNCGDVAFEARYAGPDRRLVRAVIGTPQCSPPPWTWTLNRPLPPAALGVVIGLLTPTPLGPGVRVAPGASVAVHADATQLRQVVLNLLTNAADAMGSPGGRIRVRTGTLQADAALLASCQPASSLAPGEYAFVEVRDQGAGMDAATAAKMFAPFFTTKDAGHGLGLAAVLGIARGHGGCLLVQSRPGERTAITLLLPPATAVAGAVDASPEEESSVVEGDASGPVLVVDDEQRVRAVAREILETDGFRVRGLMQK